MGRPRRPAQRVLAARGRGRGPRRLPPRDRHAGRGTQGRGGSPLVRPSDHSDRGLRRASAAPRSTRRAAPRARCSGTAATNSNGRPTRPTCWSSSASLSTCGRTWWGWSTARASSGRPRRRWSRRSRRPSPARQYTPGQRRIDPVGLPGTINVVVAKSDAAALGIHGIAFQRVTANGPSDVDVRPLQRAAVAGHPASGDEGVGQGDLVRDGRGSQGEQGRSLARAPGGPRQDHRRRSRVDRRQPRRRRTQPAAVAARQGRGPSSAHVRRRTGGRSRRRFRRRTARRSRSSWRRTGHAP